MHYKICISSDEDWRAWKRDTKSRVSASSWLHWSLDPAHMSMILVNNPTEQLLVACAFALTCTVQFVFMHLHWQQVIGHMYFTCRWNTFLARGSVVQIGSSLPSSSWSSDSLLSWANDRGSADISYRMWRISLLSGSSTVTDVTK